MKIFPNAYYQYLKHTKSAYYQRKRQIYSRIQQIYHEIGGIAGHRTMRVFLSRENIFLSKTTIHKYMNRDLQLQCICRKRKPNYQRGHAHKLFPNLVHQNFQANRKNQIWCTDFTYLYLINGSIRYNCTIIDLYDRSVVASENGKYMTSDLAIRTLDKAICASKCDPRKLILHSDQGSQFTSAEFTNHCRGLSITQSMSRAGCPYDNAPMERYYNTLKAGLTNHYSFQKDKDLNNAIQEFAYLWYNQIRPHSYNQYKTPFEKRFQKQIRQWCYKIA